MKGRNLLQPRASSLTAGGLAAILLASLSLRLWNGLERAGFMVDEPENLWYSQQLFDGKEMYVDFPNLHPPYTTYLLAPLQALSTWELQRVAAAVAGVVALALLYFIARGLYGSRWGLVPVALVAISPLFNRFGIMVIPDTFMLPVLVAAMACMWQALRSKQPAWWFATGFFVGSAVLFKYTSITLAVVLGVIALYRAIQFREDRSLLLYLLGGAVHWIWLSSAWNVRALWDNTVGDNLAEYSMPWGERWSLFVNDILTPDIGLYALAAVGGVILLLRGVRELGTSESRVVLWACMAIVLLALVMNFGIVNDAWSQYYLPLLPWLALLAVLPLRWLVSRLQNLARPLAAALSAPLLFLVLVQPIGGSWYPFDSGLDAQLEFADYVRDMDTDTVWEPWVFYAYLGDKQFAGEMPVWSRVTVPKHLEEADLAGEIEEADAVLIHQPYEPPIRRIVDLILTGQAEWALVHKGTYRTPRWSSSQPRFWYPGSRWETEVFQLDAWRRSPVLPGKEHVVRVGFRNPTDYPLVDIYVWNEGKITAYRLDSNSGRGYEYGGLWELMAEGANLVGDYEYQRSRPLRVSVDIGAGDGVQTPDNLLRTLSRNLAVSGTLTVSARFYDDRDFGTTVERRFSVEREGDELLLAGGRSVSCEECDETELAHPDAWSGGTLGDFQAVLVPDAAWSERQVVSLDLRNPTDYPLVDIFVWNEGKITAYRLDSNSGRGYEYGGLWDLTAEGAYFVGEPEYEASRPSPGEDSLASGVLTVSARFHDDTHFGTIVDRRFAVLRDGDELLLAEGRGMRCKECDESTIAQPDAWSGGTLGDFQAVLVPDAAWSERQVVSLDLRNPTDYPLVDIYVWNEGKMTAYRLDSNSGRGYEYGGLWDLTAGGAYFVGDPEYEVSRPSPGEDSLASGVLTVSARFHDDSHFGTIVERRFTALREGEKLLLAEGRGMRCEECDETTIAQPDAWSQGTLGDLQVVLMPDAAWSERQVVSLDLRNPTDYPLVDIYVWNEGKMTAYRLDSNSGRGYEYGGLWELAAEGAYFVGEPEWEASRPSPEEDSLASGVLTVSARFYDDSHFGTIVERRFTALREGEKLLLAEGRGMRCEECDETSIAQPDAWSQGTLGDLEALLSTAD